MKTTTMIKVLFWIICFLSGNLVSLGRPATGVFCFIIGIAVYVFSEYLLYKEKH